MFGDLMIASSSYTSPSPDSSIFDDLLCSFVSSRLPVSVDDDDEVECCLGGGSTKAVEALVVPTRGFSGDDECTSVPNSSTSTAQFVEVETSTISAVVFIANFSPFIRLRSIVEDPSIAPRVVSCRASTIAVDALSPPPPPLPSDP
jgi:hypothetical protein